MIIQKAYKTEIKPTKYQRILLEKSCGTARFAYNWGLNQRIELYKKEKKSLSAFDQNKLLNLIKKEQFPWMYEVTKCAPQEALRDLERAFINFFKSLKTNKNVGFPKFKSKKDKKQSFKVYFSNLPAKNTTIKIPKIGLVRLKEKNYIPTENVKYNSITVSKKAGKWFVSVQVEEFVPEPQKPKTVLGIDMGLKTLATCSNQEVFENHKFLQKSEKKSAKANRNFSRKKKGSSNSKKAKLKLQKVHSKTANQRLDNIHKITSYLVKTKPRYFVIENLSISNMVKNHHLAKSINDVSWSEFFRQLDYKTKWYGGEVINADRFYPSSKTCSFCKNIKTDLELSDRIYYCTNCGNKIERDYNAAINLENYGLSTLGSRGIKACGESVNLLSITNLEVVSMKQEERSLF